MVGWCDGNLLVPGRPTNLGYSRASNKRGGAMVLGVILIWIIVGQGPTALAVGAGGGCLDIFFLSSIISIFCLPLFETGVVGWCDGAG